MDGFGMANDPSIPCGPGTPHPAIIGLEAGWQVIKCNAIDKLSLILESGLTKRIVPFDPKAYSVIYTKCYNMCTQRTPFNWSELLYKRHGESTVKYLKTEVAPPLQEVLDGIPLLTELQKRWSNQKLMNDWMAKFFMYLDRYYVKHTSLPSLRDSGMKHFKELVYSTIKVRVVASMLEQIDAERAGTSVDQDLLRNCVQVFEAMGLNTLDSYTADFEAKLLEGTEEYYSRCATSWLEADTAPVYLAKAETHLNAERKRVTDYLNAATEASLLKVCEIELLQRHQQQILGKEDSGCRTMLRREQHDDLARVYRLFSRVENGLIPIAQLVREHIEQVGDAAVEERRTAISPEEEPIRSSGSAAAAEASGGGGAEAEGKQQKKKQRAVVDDPYDTKFVSKLLKLHTKYTGLVRVTFQDDPLFQRALKDAFEKFVNKDVGDHTNAMLIATFCDSVLSKEKGGNRMSDDDVEAALEQAVKLFSYLQDKDVFSEHYRNALAKRLLNSKTKSLDTERAMISRLKIICGTQFTSKMEGMLNDLKQSQETQQTFSTWVTAQSGDGGDGGAAAGSSEDGSAPPAEVAITLTIPKFEMVVLTNGMWPSYPPLKPTLPPTMQQCLDVFDQYYSHATESRKLDWKFSLGDCVLRGHFAKKKIYEFNVNTMQAIVMMAFNGPQEVLTFDEVHVRVGKQLEAPKLKMLLASLSCLEVKVLRKAPPPKKGRATVKDSDKFQFNFKKFTHQKSRIRLPPPTLHKADPRKRVDEDRSIMIDASIVRIMKARKMLAHSELIDEVLSQLAVFRPRQKAIKQRIEHLIEREYLKRSDKSPNVYVYIP